MRGYFQKIISKLMPPTSIRNNFCKEKSKALRVAEKEDSKKLSCKKDELRKLKLL